MIVFNRTLNSNSQNFQQKSQVYFPNFVIQQISGYKISLTRFWQSQASPP